MSTFLREDRYYVIKKSDLDNALAGGMKKELVDNLLLLITAVEAARVWKNKPPLQTTVVEADWPIYEETWENIERWAEGEQSYKAELAETLKRETLLTGFVDYLLEIANGGGYYPQTSKEEAWEHYLEQIHKAVDSLVAESPKGSGVSSTTKASADSFYWEAIKMAKENDRLNAEIARLNSALEKQSTITSFYNQRPAHAGTVASLDELAGVERVLWCRADREDDWREARVVARDVGEWGRKGYDVLIELPDTPLHRNVFPARLGEIKLQPLKKVEPHE